MHGAADAGSFYTITIIGCSHSTRRLMNMETHPSTMYRFAESLIIFAWIRSVQWLYSNTSRDDLKRFLCLNCCRVHCLIDQWQIQRVREVMIPGYNETGPICRVWESRGPMAWRETIGV